MSRDYLERFKRREEEIRRQLEKERQRRIQAARKKYSDPEKFKAEAVRSGENPIRLWREACGLTRLDLARQAGLHYDTCYKVERGLYARIPDWITSRLLAAGVPGHVLDFYSLWRNIPFRPCDSSSGEEGKP